MAARSLRMGVALLSKSLLQHLASMAPQPAFAELWTRALTAFQVQTPACHLALRS